MSLLQFKVIEECAGGVGGRRFSCRRPGWAPCGIFGYCMRHYVDQHPLNIRISSFSTLFSRLRLATTSHPFSTRTTGTASALANLVA